MNPLNSIKGTISLGFVIAIITAIIFNTGDFSINIYNIYVWLHVIFGITWIGLLYYFNFVQTPAMVEALADESGPGPAGISKYVAPKALLWFRMAAALTWLTGALILGKNFFDAFIFASGFELIGFGAWLGTIMLFNVWFIIWPNQKKILGIVKASDDEKACAKKYAAMASRTNVVLSIPMLLAMTGYGHIGGIF